MNKSQLICKEKYEGTIWKSNNYGEFKITRYVNTFEVHIKFLATGYERSVSLNSIKSGSIKDKLVPKVFDIGYTGDGDYPPSVNGLDSKSYKVWHCMLQRCYDESILERYPTYRGCTVAEEWHNFQNFAEWFEENYVEGYQLDKDIKVKGNKIYSPNTCMFVSPQENMEESRAKYYTFINPNGDVIHIYNLSGYCRENNLSLSSMTKLKDGIITKNKGWSIP